MAPARSLPSRDELQSTSPRPYSMPGGVRGTAAWPGVRVWVRHQRCRQPHAQLRQLPTNSPAQPQGRSSLSQTDQLIAQAVQPPSLVKQETRGNILQVLAFQSLAGQFLPQSGVMSATRPSSRCAGTTSVMANEADIAHCSAGTLCRVGQFKMGTSIAWRNLDGSGSPCMHRRFVEACKGPHACGWRPQSIKH